MRGAKLLCTGDEAKAPPEVRPRPPRVPEREGEDARVSGAMEGVTRVANPRRLATPSAACTALVSTFRIPASSDTVRRSLLATNTAYSTDSSGSAPPSRPRGAASLLDTKPSKGGIENRSSGKTGTSMYRSPLRSSSRSTASSRSRTCTLPLVKLAVLTCAISSGVSSRYSPSPRLTHDTPHHGSSRAGSLGICGSSSRAMGTLFTRHITLRFLHAFRIAMYSFRPTPTRRNASAAVKFGSWWYAFSATSIATSMSM
mmetsp:Transcript_19284/g.53990  ORF Transcript_19284/g.53990 Transcript_19284/m.53990 type:complete len:257 (-) Transcript_19284:319-1089(-)